MDVSKVRQFNMELNTNPTDTCRWYEAATSPFFHYFKIIRLQQNVLQDFVFHLLNHFLMKKNCLTKIKAKIDFRDMHTDSQRTYSILVWEYLKQNMRVCIKKKKIFRMGYLGVTLTSLENCITILALLLA